MWWDQKRVLWRVPSQVVSQGSWLLPVQLRLETLGCQKKKIFPKLDSLAACQLYQADSPRRRFPEWLMTEQAFIFACLMGRILQSLQFPYWVVCLPFENQIHVLCIKLTVPKKKPQPWDWVSVHGRLQAANSKVLRQLLELPSCAPMLHCWHEQGLSYRLDFSKPCVLT